MYQRVVQSLGIVFIVCIAVRVGAWLIAPILPALGVLVALAAIGYWLLGGARSGH